MLNNELILHYSIYNLKFLRIINKHTQARIQDFNEGRGVRFYKYDYQTCDSFNPSSPEPVYSRPPSRIEINSNCISHSSVS